MKFYVSKEQYAAFDEEQKQLIKDNFTFHSSGDKQWHTKEHIDIDTGYNIIVNDLELFPTVTYAPTKEQYSSLTDELKSKVRELMFWDTKQSVWESRPGKAREVYDFVRYELNAHAGFEADDSLTFQLIEGMKNIRTSALKYMDFSSLRTEANNSAAVRLCVGSGVVSVVANSSFTAGVVAVGFGVETILFGASEIPHEAKQNIEKVNRITDTLFFITYSLHNNFHFSFMLSRKLFIANTL